ncbi:hypothetical protein [Paraburkholderia kururiensis]|uniref:Uncharacterized protein n=1 Tax=Paraburkholderia kururiensis TaxID=984307 RepID=A0ABZ0WNY0_9BURK|nr:hypothetical protein [Paraburkholderia kururiensis]WQD79088.1 hypothetical protein U0042_05130 [Paraburkholderia kururiensis]
MIGAIESAIATSPSISTGDIDFDRFMPDADQRDEQAAAMRTTRQRTVGVRIQRKMNGGETRHGG